MKTRTINAVICKKIDEWLKSIDDEAVRKVVEKNIVVTGGCIASMLLREKVNDFDVYFTTIGAARAAAEYYLRKFNAAHPSQSSKVGDAYLDPKELDDGRVKIVIKSAGVASEAGDADYQYFEQLDDNDPATAAFVESQVPEETEDKPKYRPVFLSTNAVTLSDKIQLVLRFYGSPEEIHSNYDFAHCTNYWTSKDRKVVLNLEAMECLMTRELRYIGSKYPLASIVRTRKFINRGWTVTAGQYLKMMMQLNSLDLTNFKVLEDQLTGLDLAYFAQVISLLREKGGERVDAAYLCEIIDRMF